MMVKVTKLNGNDIIVNSDLIEFIESTPDTIITLTTGKKLIIKDTIEDVIAKIINFKKKVFDLPEIIKNRA